MSEHAQWLGWQPIETAPKYRVALFWVVPKTADETWCDTSGKPILSDSAPRMTHGYYGCWSSLSKAILWHELPPPPDIAVSLREPAPVEHARLDAEHRDKNAHE